MIPLHKKRTGKVSTVCSILEDNVKRCIVIDEDDSVNKDSSKYVKYMQRSGDGKFVLCDGCWDTYNHIHTIDI